MRIKVDINKGIFTDFGRNILNGCRDDYYDLSLADLSMHFLMFHIQKLTCHLLLLICLELIIFLIKSDCHRLIFTNLNPIACKNIEALGNINLRLEEFIWEGLPPISQITYHLQMLRDRGGKLYVQRIKDGTHKKL